MTYLGEFEQIVLLAVVRLAADAYGTNIRREIEAGTYVLQVGKRKFARVTFSA